MFTLRNRNDLMLHKIEVMLDPNPPLKKNWRQVGHHLNVTEGDFFIDATPRHVYLFEIHNVNDIIYSDCVVARVILRMKETR